MTLPFQRRPRPAGAPRSEPGPREPFPGRRALLGLALAALVLGLVGGADAADPIQRGALQFRSFTLFTDPDQFVATKEFALFFTSEPDTNIGPGKLRTLFHLIYQRSGGPQAQETMFGHAWTPNLIDWFVDTSAFAIDTTAWNAAHVWSPCVVPYGGRTYMFYTGVNAAGDQSIGYAFTDRLDTSNTVWDPQRVQVWTAAQTHWAVPDPSTYLGETQFRDADVREDPEDPSRLLMHYTAHDSLDFLAGHAGLAVGVARSAPGSVDTWEDLGYFPKTLPAVTHIGQLEAPHVFPVNGTNGGWRLMFANAGTPVGETGQTTIRFETLAPGASPADTTPALWSAPIVLKQYLNGDTTVFGWSGSEELRAGGEDFLAGFTAWGPFVTGIAIAHVLWNGSNFTLGNALITGVDEYRSPTRGLRMRLAGYAPHAPRVTFVVESPLALDARLDVLDTQGRRLRTLLDGPLPAGRSTLAWDLVARDGARVPSGVYFARLAFAGGSRAARLVIVR